MVPYNRVILSDVKFIGANLTLTTFKNSDLSYTEFDEAVLSSTEFDYNNLSSTNFASHKSAIHFSMAKFRNNYITDLYDCHLPTAPSPYKFRFVMNDGTYQRNPKNIDDIKQEKMNSSRDSPTKYFIHPVKSDMHDPSQEK